MENKKIRFNWKPLLLLLIPVWSLVSGFIPGFQNAEYDLIAVVDGKTIGAGTVGLFQAYMYATPFVKFFFILGLVSAVVIGIYGVFAALFPLFRGVKAMMIALLVLFALMGTGYIAGGFLLANYMERFSVDYYASQGRIFDDFNGLAFINLNLFLSMGIPGALFIWWVWTSLVHLFKKD